MASATRPSARYSSMLRAQSLVVSDHLGQEVDPLQVVGSTDDPLQQYVPLGLFCGSDTLHQRLGLQPPCLGQACGPGPNPLGRTHHPEPLGILPPLQLLAVSCHFAIPLGRFLPALQRPIEPALERAVGP